MNNHHKPFNKNRFKLLTMVIYASIITAVFFKVYSSVFDKKLSIGGDNAAYYILGTSIASGNGYTNIHQVSHSPHNHFPVGYPLVIAGISKFISNDIQVIKKVNGLFLFLSISLLFLTVRELTKNVHLAFISSLFALVNYHLLGFSFIMMSEIPFLFFFHLALWLIVKLDYSLSFYKNWRFILLIVIVAICYHIRTIGIALFLGILISLVWQKKWHYSISLLLGFTALGIPWYLRNKRLGGNYINQLIQKNPYQPELGVMDLTDWFGRLWVNLERYIVQDVPNTLGNLLYQVHSVSPHSLLDWVIGVSFLSVIIFGLANVKKEFLSFTFILLGFAGILLLWPPVWGGQRFLITLIPVLLFLLLNGIFKILEFLTKKLRSNKFPLEVLHLLFVITSLTFLIGYSKKGIDTLQKKAASSYNKAYENYFTIAKWLKENSKGKAVVSCRKDNLFYLYSNQYVTRYKYTLDTEELIADLKDKQVQYVVLEQLGFSTTMRYLYPAIQKHPEKFRAVLKLKNPDTYLLQFFP